MVERSPWLVWSGWILLIVLYLAQVCLFTSILIIHLDNEAYVAWFLWFVIPVAVIVLFIYTNKKFYADSDETAWGVWIIWGSYIFVYIVTVGTVFGTVAHKLTKNDALGINALVGTLCITPGLLILLLQLMICPSYRKPVLSLSIFAALNIFDGIEMLEVFLMQKEANFDLNKETEICIVFFACFCFFLSPFGLVRNQFKANGVVKERRRTSLFLGPLEIIGTNLPFLVLRAAIWHKYKATILIAKNAVALVVGGVQFLIPHERKM